VVVWIGFGLARNRDKWRALVETVLNLYSPQHSEKFLSGFTSGGLSSSAQLHRVILFRTC
jgi:hypothetical protein